MLSSTMKSHRAMHTLTPRGYRGAAASSAMARQRFADIAMSVAYFAIGFAPITALAISLMGFLPLWISAWVVVVPAAGLGVLLGIRFPRYGTLALKGFGIGIIAVTLYDGMRAPFIALGIWGDFIPNIGGWLLNTPHPSWLMGYLYRYLGDGGGMGMAFTVGYSLLRPRLRCWLAAIGYGLAIWGCLMLTLLLAPNGQESMFRLTPTSFTLSLLGHVVYGATIGVVLTRSLRNSPRAYRQARRVLREASGAYATLSRS
ncbi:MAG TPA: hypothetical protein VF807_05995 [Ktedonobacterales bacterium]